MLAQMFTKVKRASTHLHIVHAELSIAYTNVYGVEVCFEICTA
jgi:hypothetical protein